MPAKGRNYEALMNIVVIDAGYVGLVVACCLAEPGGCHRRIAIFSLLR